MVTTPLPVGRIEVSPRGRDNPMPPPVARRTLRLPTERIRERHPTRAGREIRPVQSLDDREMPDEQSNERGRHHRDSVTPPLGLTDADLANCEIQILDTQLQGFEETQSRSIQQPRHEPDGPPQAIENPLNLGPRQDDRKSPRLPGTDPLHFTHLAPEHLAIQEQERAQSLILRGGTDPIAQSEMRQVLRDVPVGEVGWMP